MNQFASHPLGGQYFFHQCVEVSLAISVVTSLRECDELEVAVSSNSGLLFVLTISLPVLSQMALMEVGRASSDICNFDLMVS